MQREGAMTRHQLAEKLELLALAVSEAAEKGDLVRSERKALDNATTLMWATIHDLRTKQRNRATSLASADWSDQHGRRTFLG
jgi:hypothetical protein